MIHSFPDQFDRHGAWRTGCAQRIAQLSAWLTEHRLADAPMLARLAQIADGLQRDKVMVAFVAEFSRGKSELINAIFFAHYGRRIVPASAGRTTMCPTEFGFESGLEPGIRLLPIETRTDSRPLSAWRAEPPAWTSMRFDTSDPAGMAQAMETVAQVRRVSVESARDLGFWDDDEPDDNPPRAADGLVEIPMWRHALVNIDHPLLRQGLVVLDTPGLNAVGAEPDLTVQLLAEAHASVFLLAADTGVTRSDLQLWRQYLAPRDGDGARADNRVVVLNKIDVLWDGISSGAQIRAQTDRQRATSASLLGVVPARVIPVSAQRGLVARIQHDAGLLQASGLPLLEAVLAQELVASRHAILRDAIEVAVARVRVDTVRLLTTRRREIDEQAQELRGLRGKNDQVIAGMRFRVDQERQEFDASEGRIQALHAVRNRLESSARAFLQDDMAGDFAELQRVLGQSGLKLGARRLYQEAFARSAARMQQADKTVGEIHAMLTAAFRQLNADFGFALQVPAQPAVGMWAHEIERIERAHAAYVGVGQALRLAQPAAGERLSRALQARVQSVLVEAAEEITSWCRSAMAPVDTQLRERRSGFVRRIEAIDRIRDAASGLGERLGELEKQAADLTALEAQLREWASVVASGAESVNDADGAPIAAAGSRPEPDALPAAA
ncbi:dynamin family protein [Xylophilus sp. GOD-11R]|uniref:dynamin family protein n=1 Tax=Xylophilus sp. GOD-11R TaxID=3089814 RepID=UPI00298C43A9|nr:dynamin family protein [Xylophilus sp. GOD-11R]WPB56563.1 dynamin family protein [Xylophilus sp. GOD-11R]